MKHNWQPMYRALCRELHLDDDTRRDMNAALTGHRSSGDFSQADWARVIDWMRERAGQPPLRRSARRRDPDRLRATRSTTPGLDSGATPDQIAELLQLEPQLDLHSTAEMGATRAFMAYVASCAFGADRAARQRWLDAHGTLETLTPAQAHAAIRGILRHIACRQKRLATAGAPGPDCPF